MSTTRIEREGDVEVEVENVGGGDEGGGEAGIGRGRCGKGRLNI